MIEKCWWCWPLISGSGCRHNHYFGYWQYFSSQSTSWWFFFRHWNVFPTQYLGGCNCSFRPVWLSQHTWTVYSFVCKPLHAWHKKSKKSKEHESCLCYQKALKQAEDLKISIEHPSTNISAVVDTHIANNIECNRAILKAIASAVLYCRKQGIAPRGNTKKFNK